MTEKLKNFTMTVAALAMTLLMTQCRKPDIQMPGGSYVGTSQYITFSTGDNSKITISPVETTLKFKWQKEDKLYVYGSQDESFSEGKYCGELKITKGVGDTEAEFSGTLNNVPDDKGFLRLYYFANGVDADHTATVDLSSQCGTLEALASKFVAVSVNIPFKKGKRYYESPLTVPYALANFDLHEFSGESAVTMKGNTCNGIKVGENGELKYTAAEGTNGDVTLSGVPAESKGYYVAIMPVDGGISFSGNGVISETSKINFEEDKYYTASDGSGNPTGAAILVPEYIPDYLPGLFSVGDGKQVRFSKGNLQYLGKGTDETHNAAVWRFADHQWDIMGASYGNGTLGGDKRHGNVNFGDYYTAYNSTKNTDSPWSSGCNYSGVIDQTKNKEAWDLFVKAETGFSSTFSGWRQLEYFGTYNSEWRYLINREYKKVDATIIPRYGMGYVHNVLGIILLPDDMNNVEELLGEGVWKFGRYVQYSASGNNQGDVFDVGNYNENQWQTLESAGAVFLPCAGWRQGALVVGDVNTQGCFNHKTGTKGIPVFQFKKGYVYPENDWADGNHAPIRLVQDVSASTN